MSPVALWITRTQAVALLGVALAVVVLAATSTTSLAAGFVVSEVAAAILGVVLLVGAPRWHRARTPILLLEIIAVGIAGQLLLSAHRPLVAAAVGLPAVAAAVALVGDARGR